MPYRIRYTVNIDWVGPGAGPMEALDPTGGSLPGGGSNGQSLQVRATPGYSGTVVLGAGTTGGGQPYNGSIVAADITNLTNAMAADAAAQFEQAANLAAMQGWPGGNP